MCNLSLALQSLVLKGGAKGEFSGKIDVFIAFSGKIGVFGRFSGVFGVLMLSTSSRYRYKYKILITSYPKLT